MADNLDSQRLVLIAHHKLCVKVGVACEEPMSDIDLGHIFYARIDWDSGLQGLQGWLFSEIDKGLAVLSTLAKSWCQRNPSAVSAIEAVSSNVAFSQAGSSLRASTLPCYKWDGRSCAYEQSSGKKCSFSHPRGQDTRQERSGGDRSRSRSRDRGARDQRGQGSSSSYARNSFRSDRSDDGSEESRSRDRGFEGHRSFRSNEASDRDHRTNSESRDRNSRGSSGGDRTRNSGGYGGSRNSSGGGGSGKDSGRSGGAGGGRDGGGNRNRGKNGGGGSNGGSGNSSRVNFMRKDSDDSDGGSDRQYIDSPAPKRRGN